MFPDSRLQLVRWLCGLAALLLAACQAASTAAPTATADLAATATATPFLSTGLPLTATTLPTDTAAPSSSPTSAPTVTPSATATQAPTDTPSATVAATATATARPTALATRAPLTTPALAAGASVTPLGPPATNSVYRTTSGPAGFSSTIQCQRAGAECAGVMPPGDISFRLTLAGDAGAPWTHFVYYGLSVEKDGANLAGDFMFVDAGWLQPGAVVGFGASRAFSEPGAYVIRSSGCLNTDRQSRSCVWATIAGDVVTFTIQ